MANFSQFFSDESDLYKELTTRTTAPLTDGQLLQINASATRIDGVDQTIQQVTGVAQTVPPGQVIYNTTEVYINNTVNNITAAADVDLATVVGLVLLEFTPSVSTDDTVQTQVVTSPANGIDNIIVGSGSLWDVPAANSGDIDDLGSGTRLNFSTSDPIALLKETAESQTDIAEFIGTFTSTIGASFYMGNVDSDDTYATTAPTPVAKYTYDLSLTTDTTISIVIADTDINLSISAASAIDDQTTLAGSTEYSTDLQQVITSFANSVAAHAGADSPTTYSIFYRGADGLTNTFLGNVTSVTTTSGSEEIAINLSPIVTTLDITSGDILSVQLVSFVYSTESSMFSVSGGVGFEGFSDGLLYPIGSDGNGNIIPFVNADGAGSFTTLTNGNIPTVVDGTFTDSAITQASVDNEGTTFNTVSITSVGEGGAQNSLNVNGTTISASGVVSASSLALQNAAVADDSFGGGTAPDALIYRAGAVQRIAIGAVGEVLTVVDNNPLSLEWAAPAGGVDGINSVTTEANAVTGADTITVSATEYAAFLNEGSGGHNLFLLLPSTATLTALDGGTYTQRHNATVTFASGRTLSVSGSSGTNSQLLEPVDVVVGGTSYRVGGDGNTLAQIYNKATADDANSQWSTYIAAGEQLINIRNIANADLITALIAAQESTVTNMGFQNSTTRPTYLYTDGTVALSLPAEVIIEEPAEFQSNFDVVGNVVIGGTLTVDGNQYAHTFDERETSVGTGAGFTVNASGTATEYGAFSNQANGRLHVSISDFGTDWNSHGQPNIFSPTGSFRIGGSTFGPYPIQVRANPNFLSSVTLASGTSVAWITYTIPTTDTALTAALNTAAATTGLTVGGGAHDGFAVNGIGPDVFYKSTQINTNDANQPLLRVDAGYYNSEYSRVQRDLNVGGNLDVAGNITGNITGDVTGGIDVDESGTGSAAGTYEFRIADSGDTGAANFITFVRE